MCRHIGYLGPAVTAAALLYDAPHGLVDQARSPRFVHRPGSTNPDGFGICWYTADGPARIRRAEPIWTDRELPETAAGIRSTCLLAAVREATPGFPVQPACNAPFLHDRWAFSHNGSVRDVAALRAAVENLPTVPDAEAPVDSALLFRIAVAHWLSGASLADGLAATMDTALGAGGGRLNLLATDGGTLAATAYGHSLFVLARPGLVVVASEPYDDAADWEPVPDGSLLTGDEAGVTVEGLWRSSPSVRT
jgi:glutamine amidotransferase